MLFFYESLKNIIFKQYRQRDHLTLTGKRDVKYRSDFRFTLEGLSLWRRWEKNVVLPLRGYLSDVEWKKTLFSPYRGIFRKNKQTDRQTDRQTNKQKNKQTYIFQNQIFVDSVGHFEVKFYFREK